jgi:serine/threonine protein kinase
MLTDHAPGHTGFHDKRTVKELLKECSKMYTLDHPNVLTLSGVCLDGGTAPYIIMPFMANGSLLAYLKSNRRTLVASQEAEIDDEEVSSLTLTSLQSVTLIY